MRVSGLQASTMMLICLLSTIACSTKDESESVKVYVDSLVSSLNPSDESRSSSYPSGDERSLIDRLVKDIDTNLLIDPFDFGGLPSSEFPNVPTRNRYAGELSLYHIEQTIRHEDWFGLLMSSRLEDTNDPALYGLWGYVEVQGTDSISHSDMVEIKKLYIDWWDRVKNLPIKEIREDWEENGGPLANTKYKVR